MAECKIKFSDEQMAEIKAHTDDAIKEVKKNTIIIPPDATNGNMFIRAYGYEIKGRASGRVYLEGVCFGFDEGWWDSPYIKPDET